MRGPTHGVVSLAALDVRRAPDHRSELVSQLLLGETVLRLSGRDREGWWRVEGVQDDYRGWVRTWGLVPVSGRRAGSWRARASARVAVPVAEVRAGAGRGASVGPLYLNSVVIPGVRRGRFRRVELPDGRRGWLPASALARRGERVTLLERVLSLLGAPYHWGGRTPLGYDCSGFSQQVLAEQGLSLPRDCLHQFRACRALREGQTPLPGDLIFFGDPGRDAAHVGIGLGGGYFAHCRGLVMMSSVDVVNPLCAKELISQFMGWRRPPGGPLGGTGTTGRGGDSA
jgi:cell wall-associated NlpC family hydrolase